MLTLDSLKAFIVDDIKKLEKSDQANNLLALSYGRVIVNAYKKNAFEIETYNSYKKDLVHISDWVEAAIVNDAAWLSNLDNNQRPKKIMKFSSVDQIIKEVEKDLARFLQQNKNVTIAEGDERLIMMLNDGYYIVQLLTPKSLDKESSHMQHCIGNGAYDDNLHDHELKYYSLRDVNGKPHVTMEINETISQDGKRTHEIAQFQGKQNKKPNEKYSDIILPFFQSEYISLNEANTFFPYIRDDHNNWHNIYNLPNILEISDFNVNFGHQIYIRSDPQINMPQKLIGTKNLHITGVQVNWTTDYPKDMNISLREVRVSNCPDILKTEANLLLESCEFDKELTKIEAHDLTYTSYNMKADTLNRFYFSKEMIAHNHLIYKGLLPNTQLNIRAKSANFDMPRECFHPNVIHDIRIDDIATFSNCKMRVLPKGLKVGELELFSTNVSEIPDEIEIRDRLGIVLCPIQKITHKLSEDLRVQSHDNIGRPLKEFRIILAELNKMNEEENYGYRR